MPAPKENKFWLARSTHGRGKIFKTPQILWEAANEYFEWVSENPWYRNEAVKSGPDVGKIIKIPVERPMSIEGLCIFLDVETQTFRNYCSNEAYKDFFGVTTRIKDILRTQKFEGAAIGTFNANIIARDLGLRDAIDQTSSDGSMSPKATIIVKDQSVKDEIEKLG